MRTLANDAFVMLDPAVEVLDVELAEHRLLCHGHFDVAMVVPPGEGLLAFVQTLAGKPVSVATLRKEFDDQELIDRMLESLSEHGFIHETSPASPSRDELTAMRNTVEDRRKTTLRRSIAIDLDAAPSIEQLCDVVKAADAEPRLRLRCARLGDHATVLADLAHRRQAGTLRLFQTVVQTLDPRCDADVRQSLVRLEASVHLDGVTWPEPDAAIPGVADLTRHCLAVHACMCPDLSILDEAVRARAMAWGTSAFISGLCLTFDAHALWPAGAATEDDFVALFDAVRAIEEEFGDVVISNMPSDDVLLGAASYAAGDDVSEIATRLRKAYLRWRIPVLKSYEADNTWSQTPEAEEKLVRRDEDLLPSHPELLGLGPGSVLVDVCGGLGRVARRLAPSVGPGGLVISFEMLRCLSDRARQVACERRMTNLSFRPGLAQRIALPDETVDACVNEWTGAIWELGLGPAMVQEMARVVRPGGRIAVTHRIVQIPLTALGEAWIQYDDIYERMRAAFDRPELIVLSERIWGQTVQTLTGELATNWRKQYLPRLVDPFDWAYESDERPGPRADVYLTIIAERR